VTPSWGHSFVVDYVLPELSRHGLQLAAGGQAGANYDAAFGGTAHSVALALVEVLLRWLLAAA
jgi:hypothetical protein